MPDPLMTPNPEPADEKAPLFAPKKAPAITLPRATCKKCQAAIFYALSNITDARLPLDAVKLPSVQLVYSEPGSDGVKYVTAKQLLELLAMMPQFRTARFAGFFGSHWNTCPYAAQVAAERDAKKR